MKIQVNNNIISGIITAFASSICCIVPLVAAIGGTASGFASSFAWVEPARPYLIGLTVLTFGYAFYQAYKPQPKVADCCATKPTANKNRQKRFLWIAAIASLVLMSFPYYSGIFTRQTSPFDPATINNAKLKTATFCIKGMTCRGCEEHINSEYEKLKGVVEYQTSYEKGNSIIKFDDNKVSLSQIEAAIKSTGYELTKTETK